jgi:hypothetical protein
MSLPLSLGPRRARTRQAGEADDKDEDRGTADGEEAGEAEEGAVKKW